MSNDQEALTLKYSMDKAISAYIAHCTGYDASDVDYGAINEGIDDAIEMLGGTPAKEIE